MLPTATEPDTCDHVVKKAEELTATLAAAAPGQCEARRLDDDVLEALTAAELFALRRPRPLGGLEADPRTILSAVSAVARGDGSSGWNVAAGAMSAWLAGVFPDAVQERIFADEQTRLCSVLSPTATATPCPDGFVLDGRWAFVSGAWHAHWQIALAMSPTPDGAGQWPVLVAVAMDRLELLDDWKTTGLRATGSVTTVAHEIVVPSEQVYPLPLVLQGVLASERNTVAPAWRAPMMATGCATFAGTAVGLAEAALEAFLERLPDRKITYSDYQAQADAAVTHAQVSEAAMTVDEARFQAEAIVWMIEEREGVHDWTVQDRVLARGRLGRVFDLAHSVTESLRTASGASSLYDSSRIGRIAADVAALRQHALMHPSTNRELHGRVLCGQAPNSQYI